MKSEFLSEICPIKYDREIYPMLVMGINVGQLTLDGDMVIHMNPESKFYVPETPLEEAKPQIIKLTHGVQGAFYPFNSYTK